jgi:hypothetical protein
MYDAATLQQNFTGLVGLFQPYDPAYNQLPEYLNVSTSGRYVQTTHPLCTLENLYNSAPEFNKFNYPGWDNTTAYTPGYIVSSSGTLFMATRSIAAYEGQPVLGSPSADDFGEDTGAMWKRFDPFSDWLNNNVKAATLELFSDLVKHRKLEHSNRSLLDSQKLFEGIGYYSDRIIPSNRFTGMEITLPRQEGITAVISRIGLQLDTPKDITLYLYHTSVSEPLATFDISITKPSTFNWQAIEGAMLRYYNNAHDTGGSFLLGYYEADLGGAQAIHRNFNFVTGPCTTCNESDITAFNRWSKWVKIKSFSIASSYLNEERTLFDVRKANYDPAQNWGLNLSLTVSCDLTEVFSTSKHLFADALAKKICLKFLAQIAYSTRMNAIPDKIKALAMADLDSKGSATTAAEYLEELQALALDFSGMNTDCMPCLDKKRIKMGAV